MFSNKSLNDNRVIGALIAVNAWGIAGGLYR